MRTKREKRDLYMQMSNDSVLFMSAAARLRAYRGRRPGSWIVSLVVGFLNGKAGAIRRAMDDVLDTPTSPEGIGS